MKIKHGSRSELSIHEDREQRHRQPRPSSMSIVYHEDYINLLSDKMKAVDPDGKKATEIANKYRSKEK